MNALISTEIAEMLNKFCEGQRESNERLMATFGNAILAVAKRVDQYEANADERIMEYLNEWVKDETIQEVMRERATGVVDEVINDNIDDYVADAIRNHINEITDTHNVVEAIESWCDNNLDDRIDDWCDNNLEDKIDAQLEWNGLPTCESELNDKIEESIESYMDENNYINRNELKELLAKQSEETEDKAEEAKYLEPGDDYYLKADYVMEEVKSLLENVTERDTDVTIHASDFEIALWYKYIVPTVDLKELATISERVKNLNYFVSAIEDEGTTKLCLRIYITR